MSEPIERSTKTGALKIVLNNLSQVIETESVTDGVSLGEVVTPVLAEDILDRSWQRQFDDDPTTVLISIRELVDIAVEEFLLKSESK